MAAKNEGANPLAGAEASHLYLQKAASVVVNENTPQETRKRCLTREGDDSPHDGLRAWSVAAGSFLAGLAVMGLLYSNGIFVVALMKEFKSALSDTSLVSTMGLAMFYVGGLVATHAADYYGVRPVIIVGAIIWTLGWILGSFSTALWHSIMAQGVVMGLGTAVVYWPVVSILPQWFRKYRATAMGFAVLGSGIGSIIMSFGGQQMIITLGWRNCLRVIGGLGSFLLIFAILLIDRRAPPRKDPRGVFHGIAISVHQLMRFNSARIFMTSVLFFQFSFFVPYTFIASYSTELGFDGAFSGFALAMLGIGSAVGRIVFGPIADRFGRLATFRVNCFLAALSLGLWDACNTESSILAFAFFYGMFGGGFAAMFAVVAADIWGPERLSAVFTMVNLAAIPGAFASGPAIGAMVQSSGSYTGAIGLTCGMMAFAWVLLLFVRMPKPAHSPAGRKMEHLPASSMPSLSPQEARSSAAPNGAALGTSPEVIHADDLEANNVSSLIQSDNQQKLLEDEFKAYDVDISEIHDLEERERYIRALQLTKFRDTLPDPPPDVFTRALTFLHESSFEDLKQKVITKFGTLPQEWQYEEMKDNQIVRV